MKTSVFLTLPIVLLMSNSYLFSAPVSGLDPTTMDPKEIVQSLITPLQNGWNTTNPAEFAKPWSDVAEFVDIRGTHHAHVTPLALGDAHMGLWMSIYKGSQINYEVLQAARIDEHTILAHVSATLNSPGGPFAGVSSSTITLIATDADGGWKIKAFHNTLVLKQ